MGVSPYAIFLKQTATNSSLKGLRPALRSKAASKLYKALPAAEKAALIKTAKAAKPWERTKVQTSVLEQARAKKIPTTLVKKSWFSTKGSTQSRLNQIAKKAGLVVRKV